MKFAQLCSHLIAIFAIFICILLILIAIWLLLCSQPFIVSLLLISSSTTVMNELIALIVTDLFIYSITKTLLYVYSKQFNCSRQLHKCIHLNTPFYMIHFVRQLLTTADIQSIGNITTVQLNIVSITSTLMLLIDHLTMSITTIINILHRSSLCIIISISIAFIGAIAYIMYSIALSDDYWLAPMINGQLLFTIVYIICNLVLHSTHKIIYNVGDGQQLIVVEQVICADNRQQCGSTVRFVSNNSSIIDNRHTTTIIHIDTIDDVPESIRKQMFIN